MPRKPWLAAAVAATATDNQRGTVELVIPRIHISWFGRCGVDLNIAGRCAFGRGAAEALCAPGSGARRQVGRVASLATAAGEVRIAAAAPAAAISGAK